MPAWGREHKYDDEHEDCCDAEHRVRFYAAIATALIVFGLLQQNWGVGGFHGLGFAASYPGWGIYGTKYILFSEALAFASAPVSADHGDTVVLSMQVGFGLIAASSLAVALAAHMFPPMNNGGVGDILILVHILALGLGGICVAFCATLGAKEAGHFERIPDLPVLGHIFGGITAVYLVIILLLVLQKMPMTTVMFLLVKQASVAAWLTIVAITTGNRAIAAWIVLSFAVCWLIMHNRPSPWETSVTFNHEALCHCIEMYYMAGTFTLCDELIEQGSSVMAKMHNHLENFQHRFEEEMGGANKALRNDRCCDDCVGRK